MTRPWPAARLVLATPLAVFTVSVLLACWVVVRLSEDP
jgi:hypothetical protein